MAPRRSDVTRPFSIGLLIVSALLALATLHAFQAPTPSVPAQAPSPDPIDLWAKLYPVFSHPRCVNCHGVVEGVPGNIRALTGRNHGGGPVDPVKDDCGDCHSEPTGVETAWQFTAPDRTSLSG